MHHAPQDDDHPTADMYNGQRFVNRVYEALRANPALWRKTLLVITYDEHGGFYDHVVPPTADLRSRDPVLGSGAGGAANTPLATAYGLRVPTFVVSPWVPAGKGPSLVLDHCSILKTVLARFCSKDSAFLSDRVTASHSLEAFLSAAEPRLTGLPPRPALAPLAQPVARLDRALVTAPVSRQALLTGQADFHELGGLLARTLGRR
jgi:phospholipase C